MGEANSYAVRSRQSSTLRNGRNLHGPETIDREALIDTFCATAIDFPNCEPTLERGELTTWGLGLAIRLKPGS